VVCRTEDFTRPPKPITIISYTLAGKFLKKQLASVDWKAIVCDESHSIRTSVKMAIQWHDETEMTRSIVGLLRKARHAVLLSGTPSMAKPIEMFHQLSALRPAVFGTEHEKAKFGRRFHDLEVSHGTRYDGSKFRIENGLYCGDERQHELNVILKATVMVRRLKSEVLAAPGLLIIAHMSIYGNNH